MIENYGRFFESLDASFQDSEFRSVFAKEAHFADPFQTVLGVEKIIAIFRHMYATLDHPHFEILEMMGDDKKGYIFWRFYYNDRSFDGVSRITFDSAGKVSSHIDYWDAASNVYEKIPLIGSLLRFIKKRLCAS